MKLRYYLRGLGIGMLVAALVLILSGNTGGRMSDEAVKQRAMQLGMVEKDKSVLGEIQSGESPSNETAAEREASRGGNPEDTPISEGAEAGQEEEDASVSDVENEEDPDVQETAEVQDAEQALADEIEQRADEVVDRATEVAENAVQGEVITFVVERGDTSVSVARRAQEMGLVRSAADFDVFLCQNGYDKRISIGSYEITVGESEKEIADKITRSK